MINMIWAMDKNNLIGDGNRIPWHVKEDLIYYKNKTKGQTVLMGDATYFSLKSYYKTKPLPYGKCYIATIDKNLKIENPHCFDNPWGKGGNVLIGQGAYILAEEGDFDLI